MSADSASDVSGPVATMTGAAGSHRGIAVTSSRHTVMRGWLAIASVIVCANRSRSTASAAPAGTRLSSAARMTSEPRRRISSFSRPTALSSLSPRNELLHTSSARRSVLCTAVGRTGRISYSVTGTPRDAICQAASHPARPPPMIRTIRLSDVCDATSLLLGRRAPRRFFARLPCRLPLRALRHQLAFRALPRPLRLARVGAARRLRPAGAAPRRASSSARASSSDSVAGSMPFGTDALISPSVM